MRHFFSGGATGDTFVGITPISEGIVLSAPLLTNFEWSYKKIFPLEISRPEVSSPITFRHLTSHASGIVDNDDYNCTYLIGDAPENYQIEVNLPEYASFGYPCPKNSPVILEGFLAGYPYKGGIFIAKITLRIMPRRALSIQQ